MAKSIREVDGDGATLEEIHAVADELKRAREALDNAKLVLKAAKETEASARDRLDLLVGAKTEQRPLFEEEPE